LKADPDLWLAHVVEALRGIDNKERYSFAVARDEQRDKLIQQQQAAAAAAAMDASPNKQRGAAASSTPASKADSVCYQLKIAHHGGTLIRFPLDPLTTAPQSLSTAGAASAAAGGKDGDAAGASSSAPPRPSSPFGAYRVDSLSLLERAEALTGEMQQRHQKVEEQRTFGQLKLVEQIEKLQRKALVSCCHTQSQILMEGRAAVWQSEQCAAGMCAPTRRALTSCVSCFFLLSLHSKKPGWKKASLPKCPCCCRRRMQKSSASKLKERHWTPRCARCTCAPN
jgi:hypothetical protein